MKNALLVVMQFVLFFVVFLGGSLADPFKLKWFVSHPTVISTRYFVPDGLILMVIVYGIILAAEAGMKRTRMPALLTSIAFVLALVVGMLSKFGWATHDLF